MKKSRLILLLWAFSKKELRDCKSWLEADIHNTRADLRKLYDFLTNEITGFREDCLDKQLAWQTIYPKRGYSDGKMRQLLHFLLRAVEEFVAFQQFKANPLSPKLYLLRDLRQRQLARPFEQIEKESRKLQETQRHQNFEYHRQVYEFEVEHFRASESKGRTEKLDLQGVSDALDKQYFADKLRKSCLLLSRQTVYKTDYQPKMIEVVLEKVLEYDYLTIPAIGAYYHCYLALSESPEADQHFQRLQEHLEEHASVFPANEIRELYLLAINYIIKRINSGSDWHLQKAFEIYKSGITKGFLLLNKVLSPWTYRNAIISALRLEEFDWAARFIEDYKSHIEKPYRNDIYQECLAKLYYAKADYNKALKLLTKVHFQDILQQLNAKTMLAKIYYELDEIEALESLLESIKTYLSRKRVLNYHKKNYRNIIKLFRKLIKVNPYDKQGKQNLEILIRNTSPLTEQLWLLDQMQRM